MRPGRVLLGLIIDQGAAMIPRLSSGLIVVQATWVEKLLMGMVVLCPRLHLRRLTMPPAAR